MRNALFIFPHGISLAARMFDTSTEQRYDFGKAIPSVLATRDLASCLYLLQTIIAERRVVPYVNVDLQKGDPMITILLDIFADDGVRLDLETIQRHFTRSRIPDNLTSDGMVNWFIFGGVLRLSRERYERFLEHFTYAGHFCITIGYAFDKGVRIPAPKHVKQFIASAYTTLATEDVLALLMANHNAAP